ncbi:3-deoxy-D-manno-octulosonic acid transferase [Paracoccus sp. Z118]|uniref:3-deoxy-D-manno-octulosonic acid transferase n=1 Tax=Paracoccus sp. Z118 TaxID=2851017 RepID=UPI001C2C6403|nr:glycosyltransferase N-terminal domain-containing protein [Paracoccus sp. Z118]MBV0892445.1 3-deoxy-D-manno-octulosonic acid transferase [Paracoccus sp. Z118]
MAPAIHDLALWRRLRPALAEGTAQVPNLPPGDGPLIVLHGGGTGAAPVAEALMSRRKDLRLGTLGPAAAAELPGLVPLMAKPPGDMAGARALIAQAAPAAIVLFEGDLPRALLAAAEEAGVPVTLIQTRPFAPAQASWWRSNMPRGVLGRISRLLVPDTASRIEALRQGVAPARIEVTGQLTPVRRVLSCNAREYEALQAQLRSRHLWLAAALPLTEAEAVIAAHLAVLAYNHRALLIAAPARAADEPALAELAEEAGLSVARRVMDDEPGPDMQVLVAEDMAELGLWYRLASVTFAGGTLSPPPDFAARHPFEPAALGSAIIHGSDISAHPLAWRQLRAAGATRRIDDAAGLAVAASDLTSPDLAARMAQAAWGVETSGAAVAGNVAAVILSDIDGAEG